MAMVDVRVVWLYPSASPPVKFAGEAVAGVLYAY